ncbi:hypothetical protein BKA69DRAFT_1044673 [Paraphysoderma sedebokerense]|nr:hypothetical protein BKA69DRAFT_1044673 [Paraphysoderma sedebokerense]
MPHQPSLQLFKHALRTVSKFPVPPLRSKLRYNVRDLFETYRNEVRPAKINQLIQDGYKDVEVIGAFQHLPREQLGKLFKNYKLA